MLKISGLVIAVERSRLMVGGAQPVPHQLARERDRDRREIAARELLNPFWLEWGDLESLCARWRATSTSHRVARTIRARGSTGRGCRREG